MITMTDEEKLKNVVKTALLEIFETRRDLMQEIVEDALEDWAFGRAIEQGLTTEKIAREEVYAILDSGR